MAKRSGITRALLALFAVLVLSACGGGDDGEETAASDTTEAEDTTTTTTSTTTSTTTTTTTTTTTSTTTTEPPAVEEDPDAAADNGGSGDGDNGFLDLGFSDVLSASAVQQLSSDEQACIEDGVTAQGLSLDDDFDQLGLDDQAAAAEVVIDCAPDAMRTEILGSMTADDGVIGAEQLDAAAQCTVDELARNDEDQLHRIRAFLYLGENLPVPEDSIDAGAAALATCFDFGELMSSFLTAEDEAMQEAVDSECLSTVFDQETSEALFRDLLANPDAFDEDEPPESFLVVFQCFAFGQMMAAQFADFVELTQAEIDCIDEAFRSPDMIAAMTDPAAGGDDATVAMFGCLNPETIAALGGG